MKNKPLEPGDEDLGPRDEDLGSKNLGPKNLGPKNLGPKNLGPKENKPLDIKPLGSRLLDKNKPLAEYTNKELTNELWSRARATNTSLAITIEEAGTGNIATSFTGSTHMLKGMLYYLDLEIEDYDGDEEVYA